MDCKVWESAHRFQALQKWFGLEANFSPINSEKAVTQVGTDKSALISVCAIRQTCFQSRPDITALRPWDSALTYARILGSSLMSRQTFCII